MGDSEERVIVVDNGSDTIKAGRAGEVSPQLVIPSTVGITEQEVSDSAEILAGADLEGRSECCSRRSPFEEGVITDFELVEMIWKQIFENKLRVAPEEYSVLMTQPPLLPKEIRQKMTEIMFEKFGISSFLVATSAVLSLFASGLATGIVIESGAEASNVVPVYEGRALLNGIRPFEASGRELDQYLKDLLDQRGFKIADVRTIRDIKEKLCYVALDVSKEAEAHVSIPYELPDGEVVSIDRESFECPEALFEPQRMSKFSARNVVGAHQLVLESADSYDLSTRTELFDNVVLSGGNTLFSGFQRRLEKETAELVPEIPHVEVIAPQDRKYSAWLGGSVFSSLSSFHNSFITRQEYEEVGADVVDKNATRTST